MSSFLEDTSAPDANHRRRLLHTLRIAVDELGQEHPPRPGGLAFPPLMMSHSAPVEISDVSKDMSTMVDNSIP